MADNRKAYPLTLLKAEEEALTNPGSRRHREVYDRIREMALAKLNDWNLSLMGYEVVHVLGNGQKILAIASRNIDQEPIITWFLS
jgi:hypothetical protein